MKQVAVELIRSLNMEVVERIDLEGRPEQYLEIPRALLHSPLGTDLQRLYPALTLWRHQAIGLQRLLKGHNVAVATGTASGKSLIFQLYALQLIKRDPDARILVFYPLKALASDQYQRWKKLCREYGVPPEAVAKIGGEVLPTERGAAIEKASIVLMTPDVCQAWFMRNVGSGAMRRFLSKLVLLILDEAHYYKSVFGSNIAFLLRRLISLKRHVSRAANQEIDLQIVAATATIADPSEHLEQLSGRQFVAIKDEQNGAPRQPRSLLHVGGAEYGAAGELAIADIVRGIISLSQRRRFIAYIDLSTRHRARCPRDRVYLGCPISEWL